MNESPKGVGLFWQEVLTVTLLDQKDFERFWGSVFNPIQTVSLVFGFGSFLDCLGQPCKPDPPLPEVQLLVGHECKEGQEECPQPVEVE